MAPDHHELSVVCQASQIVGPQKSAPLQPVGGRGVLAHLQHTPSLRACKATKPLTHVQSRAASHVLTANEPADWPLFFSFVAAAATAFWVLFYSWYLLCGLKPWNVLKKKMSSNTKRGKLNWKKLDGMIYAVFVLASIFVPLKLQAFLEKKSWITCISGRAPCVRSWILT